MVLASDAAAIIEHTNKMVFLENGDFVKIQGGNYKIWNLNQEEIEREVEVVDWKIDEAEKGGPGSDGMIVLTLQTRGNLGC